MLRWLKRKIRPPLLAGDPYLTNPTPDKRCPVCGLTPPDWLEGVKEEDAVCVRCTAHYLVPKGQKVAYHAHRLR